MTQQPNSDEVICPNCVHQFGAIPVNVQQELAALRAQVERLQAAQGQVVGSIDHVEWSVSKEQWRHNIWADAKIPFGTKLYTSPSPVAPDGALIGEGTKPTPKLPYLPESRTVAEIQAAVDKVAQAGGADERDHFGGVNNMVPHIRATLTKDEADGCVTEALAKSSTIAEACHYAASQGYLVAVRSMRAALAAQPARVALSPEQIERIRLEICDVYQLGRLAADALARAIERHHGITPGDGGAPALHSWR